MKKILLCVGLTLMAIWATAQSLYQKNPTTNFYDYIGDPVTTDLVIDFSTITSDKVAYSTGTVHAETLIDFQQLGLFKYCYKDKRACESIEYKPLLWNSGNSLVYGTSTQNKNISNNYDFPAIYLPKMKHGIQYIVVEGWGNDNPAALQYMKQLSDGSWANLGSARSLAKNAFTRDTFLVNDRKIQTIMMHRTSTNNAYQFITKIIVKAYPAPQFEYNTTSKRYDYTGTPVEDTLTIDFSKLNAGHVCYETIDDKQSHVSLLMGFGNVGLYKWCYYASRSVGDTTYAPLLWNNGYSDVNGARKGNNQVADTLKPTIYLPTFKSGISKIVVEGWAYNKNTNYDRPLVFIGKNASGAWKKLKTIDNSLATDTIMLLGKTYTIDTLVINNRRITSVAMYYGSTDYLYITKIKVLPMEAVEPEFVRNIKSGRYDYIGDTIEGDYEVNFNELTPYDVAYNTALGNNIFADTVIEFQHIGLYKYGYRDSRKVGEVTYAPLLWNSGHSDYQGADSTNLNLYKASLKTTLPCLYFPTIKNGIYQVIIEGWSNKNARGINLIAKNTKGEWGELKDVCPHVDKDDANLGGDTYTTLTFTINSNAVKNIGTWFNSNDWQFITKVKIVPMPDNEVVIDENMDNQSLIEQYDNVTVDKLTIYRKLVKDMYNTICLPCTVTVTTFKTAAGLSECEVRYFKDATKSGESLTLDFGTTSTIQARVPYLIKPSAEVTEPIVLTNVKIEKTERNIAKPSSQSDEVLAKYFGTYSPKELNPSQNTLVLSSDNTLYYLDNKVTMGGMRGYFVLYNEAAQQPMQCQVRYLPSTTTAIEQPESANTCIKYVIDGRLIIEREGMKYNLQGERIK